MNLGTKNNEKTAAQRKVKARERILPRFPTGFFKFPDPVSTLYSNLDAFLPLEWEINSSVWDMLSLRCLFGFQVEMLGRLSDL